MIDRHQPTGLGIYTMGLHKLPPAKQAAKHAADHGLSFVAILACWQEEDSHLASNASRLAEYGAAFREAGLDVWVWGYPWGTPGRVQEFCSTMRKAAQLADAVGWILDPEIGFKGPRAAQMKPLLDLTIDCLGEGLGLGFTSYGLTTAHRDFPWDVAGGYGFGSPQTYSVPVGTARAAIEQWRARGWKHIVASLPTFGPNSEDKLLAYASAILEHCEGACFWQWVATSAREWHVIETLARLRDVAAPAAERAIEDRA